MLVFADRCASASGGPHHRQGWAVRQGGAGPHLCSCGSRLLIFIFLADDPRSPSLSYGLLYPTAPFLLFPHGGIDEYLLVRNKDNEYIGGG